MKKLLILVHLLFGYVGIKAQKPVIDSAVYGKWASVSGGTISKNGKYIFYNISNQPIGGMTLTTTDFRWKLEMTDCSGLKFSTDSKKLIAYKQGGLAIVTLGTDKIENIRDVASYKFSARGGAEWLAYQLVGSAELVLRNLNTNQQKLIKGVTDYSFSETGRTLLYQTGNGKTTTLNWINLSISTNSVLVWSGNQPSGFIFAQAIEQLAFTQNDTLDHQPVRSIWYYQPGMPKAERLIDSKSVTGNNGIESDRILRFSKDGTQLFFTVNKKFTPVKNSSIPVIWSYSDMKLHTQDSREKSEIYYYVVDLATRSYRQLCNESEATYGSFGSNEAWDNLGLLAHRDQDIDLGESYWLKGAKTTEYLLNTKDGSRKVIAQFPDFEKNGFKISPDRHFVVFYDGSKRNYCSYEIATGETRNITQNIPTEWSVFGMDRPGSQFYHYSNYSWIEGTASVILYDQNDIWLVDLRAQDTPVNLTNGYGKKHELLFRPASDQLSTVKNNQEMLLCALDRTNWDNGFYRVTIGKHQDPERLTMGPYIYDLPEDNGTGSRGQHPVKAEDVRVYLVQRMTAEESPNYFYTKDFKSFTRLSDVHPERNYNWLTTELVKWRLPDGRQSQGILYKPENFDPAKKYPVIFYYYERLSDHLHDYLEPDFATGRINIPSYVSKGYLVFTPDIHYTIGHPLLSAYHTVESAAAYLSKLSFVDSTRMGLQGHSFGGCQTGFIVAHSHRFAAACAASAIYDMISMYGSVLDKNSGNSAQSWVENTQGRIGSTPWGRPDLYIENSAIFGIDHITTPLLMMATMDDGISAFNNQLEFFMGLRRIGKKVWMLEYPGNHMVLGESSKDFTIRMQQFFDHYLKGSQAPEWMINGSKSLKLAPAGSTPGPGLLNEAEQKKVDSLLTRKPVSFIIN